MKLTDFAKETVSLKKTFLKPDGVDVIFIDKANKGHKVNWIDAAYYGTKDDMKLTVLIYEEKPNEELPF